MGGSPSAERRVRSRSSNPPVSRWRSILDWVQICALALVMALPVLVAIAGYVRRAIPVIVAALDS
jgi:membrane protein required for beta-lactamase induction